MTRAPEKYCDLVMKGGITSGIVYPNAVLALSKEFRFKNIGGTSAGAIAAAASAAAALGDRKLLAGISLEQARSKVGFDGLEDVARDLASEGFIYKLFQPAAGAGNAYRLIVTLAGSAGLPRKALSLLVGTFAIAPGESGAILVALLALAYAAAGGQGIIAALLPAFLCTVLGGALFAALRIARVARGNLLGLVSGMGRARRGPAWLLRHLPPAKPALTEWLHEVLQQLSGKKLDQPLVFADLWDAPRYPGEPETDKALTLQMITTGVSHHEPRTLPFTDSIFWFTREEFGQLFPASLVDWMVRKMNESLEIDGRIYYKLPAKGDLPVLVAMRMSLSFPLLISAVPLHEPAMRASGTATEADEVAADDAKSVIDGTDSLAAVGAGKISTITKFRVCWFSDGGISSNFPIHLFDGPLPLWPTFAINLVYPKTDDRERAATAPAASAGDTVDPIEAAIFLPTKNNERWQRTYQPIARAGAAAEIATFLFGIVGTMQNWRDLLQARAPGYRDRIVHVSLDGKEGGMNLNMGQGVLTTISKKGGAAGNRLKTFSFDNHYWIRWRNLASALQRYTIAVAVSDACQPKIPAYEDAYRTAKTGEPQPRSYEFKSRERERAAQNLLDRLITDGEAWADLGPDFSDNAPRPIPQLQIVPTY
ncbi:MAG: RpoH suppressor [Bradyrhizobium sp.]|nr:RpoH suppressor [Bradyrhizobium sp.]